MKKTIWAHTLVKNEERYLWYAVMSVIDYVDKILLWDTGSSDKTVEIIEEIKKLKGDKIDFQEVGEVDPETFTKVRQQMLDKTKSDWFLILDGDEVWWKNSIKTVTDVIQKDEGKLEAIVNPSYNIIGDIYHYQEERAGKYQIDERCGHINIRAVNRKIPGLHFAKPHGQQGLFDSSETLIQERVGKKRQFVDVPYLHFTNMIRSSSRVEDSMVPKRSSKFKHELGLKFPVNFSYPEVFYKDKPEFVPSVWGKMNYKAFAFSALGTFARKIKRKFIPSNKVGY